MKAVAAARCAASPVLLVSSRLVPLCIRLEASRIKARRLLLTPCGPTDTSEGATAPPASTWESMLNGFTTSAWVPQHGQNGRLGGAT